ncbi:MAG: tetratricopeptide repeat protein, partial [Pseudomonadota bacterium]
YGWTRYLKGEYQEARESIEIAAEAVPDNPWILYHLGMVYAALKQPDKARAALEAALANSTPEQFPPTTQIQETLGTLGTQ